MKQTSIYTAALAAALMLIPAACSDEQYDNGRTPGQQPGATGPLITVTATQGDRPQTRLGYVDHDDPAQPIEVTWATGDKFYVGKDWSALDGTETCISKAPDYFFHFDLKGEGGSKSAEFEGIVSSEVQNGDQLYAFYGDGEERIVRAKEGKGALFFYYINQIQSANNSTDHLSATDFMLATTTYETGQQPVFAFTHLGAMMKFTLTLPTAGLTVKQLTLTTTDGSKPFSKAAQWNKDGALALSNISDLNSNKLSLFLGVEGITLTGTKVLTAYMMVAPTTLTKDTAPIAGKELKLEVTDADDVVYTANLTGAEIEQGKYYTVEAELKKPTDKMSFTIEISTEADMKYSIPFPTEGTLPADITVDWGDGTEVTTMGVGTALTANDAFNHSYTATGRYTITIASSQMDASQQQIPIIFFPYRDDDNFSNAKKLISMNTPMLNIGKTNLDYCFRFYDNLNSLSQGLFDKNTQVTSFKHSFNSCASLTSVPEGLFDKHTEVTSFNGCFSQCANLTELPLGLFANNTKVTDFSNCFSGCANLTELPSDLFANNTKVTDFYYCFSGCTNLTELPSDLFANNTLATDFSWCFSRCTNLASLPGGLFANNTKVTDFGYCFLECASLTSLPEGLFNNNTLATTFDQCFSKCTKLVLNENVFSSTASPDRFVNQKISLYSCFSETGSELTPLQQEGSLAPQLWEYTGAATWTATDNCYTGCKAGNLAGIPTGWGTPAN